MTYLLRLLIALDQLLNVLICNGDPRETMSSTAYRMERDGHRFGFMRKVIDTLFWFQPHHCKSAYEWTPLVFVDATEAQNKTAYTRQAVSKLHSEN